MRCGSSDMNVKMSDTEAEIKGSTGNTGGVALMNVNLRRYSGG